ncbi:hypothetical protein MGG_17592 [Pyricularia oryzae 70-15]|uniref:Uncharacterized protein n=2 Tax=Pyricularia oryzae TaxID=318829 RepID=G4NG03_PYRO7|nr:uncharacterized protein MGG_17592 [Pyricularia oryzae 70-15]EHA46960.1 hypothetical protein MGG_17592 [Pyricularia oryzae 70-15]ELQ33886.1 hypothetical protein OOU_Y34scaffold00854g3 [Pyricularia oryzae Y34]
MAKTDKPSAQVICGHSPVVGRYADICTPPLRLSDASCQVATVLGGAPALLCLERNLVDNGLGYEFEKRGHGQFILSHIQKEAYICYRTQSDVEIDPGVSKYNMAMFLAYKMFRVQE